MQYIAVRGKRNFRPRMEIRDTGFSANQWICFIPGKSGRLTSYGSSPVALTTVAEQVDRYMGSLKRSGYVLREVSHGA